MCNNQHGPHNGRRTPPDEIIDAEFVELEPERGVKNARPAQPPGHLKNWWRSLSLPAKVATLAVAFLFGLSFIKSLGDMPSESADQTPSSQTTPQGKSDSNSAATPFDIDSAIRAAPQVQHDAPVAKPMANDDVSLANPSCEDLESAVTKIAKEQKSVEILDYQNLTSDQTPAGASSAECSASILTNAGRAYVSYTTVKTSSGKSLVAFAIARDPATATLGLLTTISAY